MRNRYFPAPSLPAGLRLRVERCSLQAEVVNIDQTRLAGLRWWLWFTAGICGTKWGAGRWGSGQFWPVKPAAIR